MKLEWRVIVMFELGNSRAFICDSESDARTFAAYIKEGVASVEIQHPSGKLERVL